MQATGHAARIVECCGRSFSHGRGLSKRADRLGSISISAMRQQQAFAVLLKEDIQEHGSSSVERGPRRMAKDFVAIKILPRLPPRHSEIIVVAQTT